MARDLFVRGFDSDLHKRISEISSREDVALSSLVEDAINTWLEQKGEVSSKHFAILYDDEDSLTNVLRISDSFTKKNWFRACCGPELHFGISFLRKHGWHDLTQPQYERILKDSKDFCRQTWDRITSEAGGIKTCAIGFMTGDLAHQKGLQEALMIERTYNAGRIPYGIMYCPYNVKDLLQGTLSDFIGLLKSHDQTFIVDRDGLYKLRINDESLYKLPS